MFWFLFLCIDGIYVVCFIFSSFYYFASSVFFLFSVYFLYITCVLVSFFLLHLDTLNCSYWISVLNWLSLLLSSSSSQVSRILYSFSTAFRRSSRPTDIRDTMMSSPSDSDLFTFSVSLDVKEDDGKGNFRYSDHSHTFEHVVMIKKSWLLHLLQW